VGVVVLEPSDDYRFVETGPDGEVEHLKPSLVAGEKHHVVSVSIMQLKNSPDLNITIK